MPVATTPRAQGYTQVCTADWCVLYYSVDQVLGQRGYQMLHPEQEALVAQIVRLVENLTTAGVRQGPAGPHVQRTGSLFRDTNVQVHTVLPARFVLRRRDTADSKDLCSRYKTR